MAGMPVSLTANHCKTGGEEKADISGCLCRICTILYEQLWGGGAPFTLVLLVCSASVGTIARVGVGCVQQNKILFYFIPFKEEPFQEEPC